MSLSSAMRDSGRLTSLAVYALVVAASLFVAFDTVSSWLEERAAVAELRERTGLLERRAAQLTGGGADGQEAAVPDARLLIEAQTSGLVSAELQRIVGSLAAGAGAAVRAMDVPESQPLVGADGEAAAVERVRVNAEIEVMEPSLPDLLYAIETHLPMLVVDEMVLRPNRRVDAAEGEAVTAAGDRALSLRLTISAFRLKT